MKKSINFASTDPGPIEEIVYKILLSTELVGQPTSVVEGLRYHMIVANEKRMFSEPIFHSGDKIRFISVDNNETVSPE